MVLRDRSVSVDVRAVTLGLSAHPIAMLTGSENFLATGMLPEFKVEKFASKLSVPAGLQNEGGLLIASRHNVAPSRPILCPIMVVSPCPALPCPALPCRNKVTARSSRGFSQGKQLEPRRLANFLPIELDRVFIEPMFSSGFRARGLGCQSTRRHTSSQLL